MNPFIEQTLGILDAEFLPVGGLRLLRLACLGNLRQSGFHHGDVLESINARAIDSTETLQSVIQSEHLKVVFRRGPNKREVAIHLPATNLATLIESLAKISPELQKELEGATCKIR